MTQVNADMNAFHQDWKNQLVAASGNPLPNLATSGPLDAPVDVVSSPERTLGGNKNTRGGIIMSIGAAQGSTLNTERGLRGEKAQAANAWGFNLLPPPP